jgi:protoporphyrinogen oxidase
VHIKNPRAPGGFSDTLQHGPFSEEAIAASVTTLMGETKTLPAYEEGYREWRKAFDAGKAGVFSITVADAVGFMESAINR